MRFFLFLALFVVSVLEARWATKDEADIVREVYKEDISVNKDGTSTRVIEMQELIARDGGREYATGFILPYTGKIETLTLLEAKTIFKGKTYKVPKDKIEDKPVASSSYGFDRKHHVLISFPKIETGARIYIKYKIVTHKICWPNAFATNIYFGESLHPQVLSYWEKASYKVHSKIPLYVKTHDPDHVLAVTNTAQQPLHDISIQLVRPFTREFVNERYGRLNDRYRCWVSLSSFKSWQELALRFAHDYASVINQSLPTEYKEILTEASQKKGEVDQINAVTSLLSGKIQYMGDWQSIEGLVIPRPLKIVAKLGQGDCKDFTAGAAAILRRMGYDVEPAFVWRHEGPPAEGTLPAWVFNHILLKIRGKTGKIYWVDPTNFESMAQGIFSDIGGKMALVLSPKDPQYERIPDVSPESAQNELDMTFRIEDQNVLNITGTFAMKGEEARWMTGAELRESRERIAERFFEMMAGMALHPEEKKFLELPKDLKSRDVKDVILKFSYDDPSELSKNNRGVGQRVWGARRLASVASASHDQVSDLYIGLPSKARVKTVIQNGPIHRIERLNFTLKTPWFEVERVCSNKGTTSEIITTSTILKRYIPVEDLKTEAYKKLRKDLIWNLEGVSLIVDEAQLTQY